jgi:hypothetical protein
MLLVLAHEAVLRARAGRLVAMLPMRAGLPERLRRSRGVGDGKPRPGGACRDLGRQSSACTSYVSVPTLFSGAAPDAGSAQVVSATIALGPGNQIGTKRPILHDKKDKLCPIGFSDATLVPLPSALVEACSCLCLVASLPLAFTLNCLIIIFLNLTKTH